MHGLPSRASAADVQRSSQRRGHHLRVLPFDPKSEIVLERPSLTAKRRTRPKSHIDRAWFYRSDFGETGEVFIAFANANGNASRRVYDAHTGRKIGETL